MDFFTYAAHLARRQAAMGRLDSDLDHQEWLNGPDYQTAICRHCGQDFEIRSDDEELKCPSCHRYNGTVTVRPSERKGAA